jgi:hypothetical protein
MRIISYDNYRGVLILAMIIFHILANFCQTYFNQDVFYWIPVGFMIFLGIILGQFLKRKPKKTFYLGLKLIGVFFIFNIPLLLKHPLPSLFDFILGNQTIFSLEILLPMGILSLGIPLLSKINFQITPTFKNKFLLIYLPFLPIAISDHLSFYSYNLLFLVYGIIGYQIGSFFNLDYFSNYSPHQKPQGLISNIVDTKNSTEISEKSEISANKEKTPGVGAQLSDYKITNKIKLHYYNLVFLLGSFMFIYFINAHRLLVILQVFSLYFLCSHLFKKQNWLTIIGQQSLIIYVGHIIVIKIIKIFLI